MKLGFVSSILDGWTYEEMMDVAAEQGFKCVEVAAWPTGKAERRYAGVTHIDAERVLVDDDYARHLTDYAAERDIQISSLAFYPNTLCPDLEKRAATVDHLENVIRASAKLGVGMVTTFIGRDQTKTVEDNLAIVTKVWPRILEIAEDKGVKIAIENCPMLFGPDQWPAGQNLFTSPDNWDRIFEILPSDNLGINFDPSHFVWQMMDITRAIHEYGNKIFHVHFKDIKLYPEKLARCGIMAYPLDFMAPKLPGLGDVDWGKYVSALHDVHYDGFACIEVEDRSFEGSRDAILDSLTLSKRYLSQFVI